MTLQDCSVAAQPAEIPVIKNGGICRDFSLRHTQSAATNTEVSFQQKALIASEIVLKTHTNQPAPQVQTALKQQPFRILVSLTGDRTILGMPDYVVFDNQTQINILLFLPAAGKI
jgi:hypothetical protein